MIEYLIRYLLPTFANEGRRAILYASITYTVIKFVAWSHFYGSRYTVRVKCGMDWNESNCSLVYRFNYIKVVINVSKVKSKWSL